MKVDGNHCFISATQQSAWGTHHFDLKQSRLPSLQERHTERCEYKAARSSAGLQKPLNSPSLSCCASEGLTIHRAMPAPA
jgi:hypothetical protein